MLTIKNKRKVGKKALCLVFAFLLSINSFAAVVSDNDGSAFITKAEFDSLKNNFQSQLDAYNTSIDSKIDSAIASYLAGVDVGKSRTIPSNVGGLTWPIKVIDNLYAIEHMNDTKTQAEQQPLWNLTMDIWGSQMRGYNYFYDNTSVGVYKRKDMFNTSLERFQPPHYDKIEYYLNGSRSSNDFVVSNLCVKPKLELSTGVIHENLPNGAGFNEAEALNNTGVFTVFVMDGEQNSDGGSWSSHIYTRKNVRANYSKLWRAKNWTFNTAPKLYFDHFADRGAAKRSINTADKYDYYDGTDHGDYIYGGQFASDYGQNLWSGNYTYTNQSIDRIYNYSDSTNATHFAPVTYDNDLYFTNKKWNRYGLAPSYRINWQGREIVANNHGVLWLTTPGENLENEYENVSAGRVWYNKALISQNRLKMTYTTPNGNLSQKMTYGIPIFYVEKKTKDVKLNINITSSSGKSSNRKYLIVSKKPIPTQKYNDNVESAADYIGLKKIVTDTAVKKIELSEGNNDILVTGDYEKNDILYIKILWNDTNDEMITLNKPNITYTEEE